MITYICVLLLVTITASATESPCVEDYAYYATKTDYERVRWEESIEPGKTQSYYNNL